jgi:hypothetical protein
MAPDPDYFSKGNRMRVILLSLLLVSGAYWQPSQAAGTNNMSCWYRLGPLLEKGGFGGDLNCHDIHVSVTLVGKIPNGKRIYSVYNFIYTTIPAPGLEVHGGQQIFIILNDKNYVGR